MLLHPHCQLPTELEQLLDLAFHHCCLDGLQITLLVLLPEPMPKAAVKATLDLPRSATSATVLDDH